MIELMISRALESTSRLRSLLEQGLERKQRPTAAELEDAMAELLAECEPLIDDRACLVPLALLLQRVHSDPAVDRLFAHSGKRAIRHDEFLRLALHDVARLFAGLSALLRRNQTTLSVVL